jgi:hypothetical protein
LLGPPPVFASAPERTFSLWELAPGILVLLGVFILGATAWLDPRLWDLGLAYKGGLAAWKGGNPESLDTWMSTSFLAMLMALATRVFPTPSSAAGALTVLNVLLLAGTLAVIWTSLRRSLTPSVWWLTLALAAFFAPVVSTILLKQINLIAFDLALAGFALLTRGRALSGGALTALSICVKPVLVLLPFALLLRRDTRRAGCWSFVWIALFMGCAQGFLALRARSVTPLSPLSQLAHFSSRADSFILHRDNFSLMATVYKLAGRGAHPPRGLVTLAVLLLAAVANETIKDKGGRSWEFFSFVCMLSPMIGPISWTHYQLFLAPMFLLLAWSYIHEGAGLARWSLLGFAYVLADLVVRPLAAVSGGALAGSQLSQYVLFASAWSWFSRGESARERGVSGPFAHKDRLGD